MDNFNKQIDEILFPYYDYIKSDQEKNKTVINNIEELQNQISSINEKIKSNKKQLSLNLKQIREQEEKEKEDYKIKCGDSYSESLLIDISNKYLEKSQQIIMDNITEENDKLMERKNIEKVLEKYMEEFQKNIEQKKIYTEKITTMKEDIISKLKLLKKDILDEYNDIKIELNKLKAKQNDYNLKKKTFEEELREINVILQKFKREYLENKNINENEWVKLCNKVNETSTHIISLKVMGDDVNLEEIEGQVSICEEKLNIINSKLKELDYNQNLEIKQDEKEIKIDVETNQNNKITKDIVEETKKEELLEINPVIEEVKTIEQPLVLEPIKEEPVKKEIIKEEQNKKYIIDSYREIKVDSTRDGEYITISGYEDMKNQIYLDIVSYIKNLNSIKIDGSYDDEMIGKAYISSKNDENHYKDNGTIKVTMSGQPIALISGVYINMEDFLEASLLYYKDYKNMFYCIENQDALYKISSLKLKLLKSQLIKCKHMKVVDSIDSPEKKKIYVKDNKDKYNLLDTISMNIKEGFYINQNELINLLIELKQKTNNNLGKIKTKIK